MNAVLVYKKTALALSGGPRGSWWRAIPADARRGLLESDAAHREALAATLTALRAEGFRVRSVYRGRLRAPIRAPLVVTVGGDGTLLEAAGWLRGGDDEEARVLAVNSDPRRSLGIFAGADQTNVRERLAAWRAGRLAPVPLPRVRVVVEGRPLRWAVLNDVLLGHQNPAGMTRYRLRVGTRSEEQRSSGLWVATGPGSTGGARSAGGPILPLASRDLSYAVREPFRGLGPAPRLLGGRAAPGAIEILVLARGAALFVDGQHRAIRLEPGARVRFHAGAPPLRILGLDPRRRTLPWRT
ncbi:MAG: hypothetical protein L0216_12650 [Planctomycetales bacterium]|nr:hypothetical protein [Planctomycetales bacterium]